MLLAMLAVFALTAVAAATIATRREGALAGPRRARAYAASPVQEAERILAHRYAKGEISAQEYDRMLSILRR
jgi:uncharacterized membrane protein